MIRFGGRKRGGRAALLAALALIIVPALLAPAHASAATFVVNELADAHDADFGLAFDGACDRDEGLAGSQCSLRAAIEEANDSTGPATDTITFSVSGTHPLALGELTVNALLGSPISIVGNGQAGGTTIDANALSRVITSAGSSVTLSDLRIEDGKVTNINGGGISSQADILTLNRVTVAGNRVDTTVIGLGGAGINSEQASDALVLNETTVSGNTIGLTANGTGAGIKANGPVRIDRSTISGNETTAGVPTAGDSGGIKFSPGLGVVNSITNSTISDNKAGDGGAGGFFAVSGDTLTILNSTIAGNSCTGGCSGAGFVSFASTTMKNTIVAANTNPAAESCNTGIPYGSVPQNNIESPGATCGLGVLNGNQQSVNTSALALGGLADNQGPTKTRELGPQSVAIGAGDNATCAAAPVSGVDQRGIIRPQGTTCDVGAFEFVPPTVPPPAGGGQAVVPAVNVPAPAVPKKCKKTQKLKKGKCVKKKRKKK